MRSSLGYLVPQKVKIGVAVKDLHLLTIPTLKNKIHGRQVMQTPIYTDDEEILAELFAFSATLTPLI